MKLSIKPIAFPDPALSIDLIAGEPWTFVAVFLIVAIWSKAALVWFFAEKSTQIAKTEGLKDNRYIELAIFGSRFRSGRTNAVRWTIGSFEVALLALTSIEQVIKKGGVFVIYFCTSRRGGKA